MKRVKIILNEDVYNLGEEGDVREVAAGYARNFLIPKGLAVPYTKHYLARFEDRRSSIERRKADKRQTALGLKERIEALRLVFDMPAGASGKLFGSVTSAQVADRLLKEGLQIERKKIELPGHTIKIAGEYEASVKLYADESATLSIAINPGSEGAVGATRSAGEEPAGSVDAVAETAAEPPSGPSSDGDPTDESAERNVSVEGVPVASESAGNDPDEDEGKEEET